MECSCACIASPKVGHKRSRQDLGALLEEARQGQARWAKVAHQLYELLS